MKKIAFITLSLLLAVSFWNCEKDDICAEGTPVTPRVIIEFFDAADPETSKNVTNLRVNELGTTNAVVFNPNLDETNLNRFLSNDNKITIPLKTFQDLSDFEFILNAGSTAETTVSLVFNYERSNVFISRACGYKTIFNLTNVLPTDFSGTWISSLTIEQPNIINENETHIKIYF